MSKEVELTAEQKKELENWVSEITVDTSEFKSRHWDPDPYGVGEPHLYCGTGCYVWDEEEEDEAKTEKAIEYLEEDGVQGYFDWEVPDEEDEEEYWEKLTQAAIKVLKE